MTCNDGDAIEDNICLPEGADYIETEWITDDNDNPVDISGDTFRAEIRIAPGEPLLASFTFEIFLDNTEPTPFYKYRRKMAQSVIATIGTTQARWDQFRELANGDSDKNFFGKVSIPENITDPIV